MSVDYYVAVHQANWPTAAAVQTCMIDLKYPVILDQAGSAPLASVRGTLGLPLRFRGRRTELEADITQLSSTTAYSYTFDRPPDAILSGGKVKVYDIRPDETWKAKDINSDLVGIGANGVSFGNGDYVLTLSFHSSSDEIRAGLYLMAAMIRCFGGYGFEFQGGTHGAKAFADGLVADAADEKQWK
jgi:hypothetical protein